MHAMPNDLRRLLLTAMAALALALVTAWILGHLGTVNLGSADGPAPASSPATTAVDTPAWLENPLASPLVELRSPAASTTP